MVYISGTTKARGLRLNRRRRKIHEKCLNAHAEEELTRHGLALDDDLKCCDNLRKEGWQMWSNFVLGAANSGVPEGEFLANASWRPGLQLAAANLWAHLEP